MKPYISGVLRQLADGEFHSGAALARTLDVSRASVWNAVRELEASGRRFPEGALGHERELLTIETLERLGKRELAGRRARAFLNQHPNSPLAQKMRRLINGE